MSCPKQHKFDPWMLKKKPYTLPPHASFPLNKSILHYHVNVFQICFIKVSTPSFSLSSKSPALLPSTQIQGVQKKGSHAL